MKLWLLAAAVVAAVAAFMLPSSATAVTPTGAWELIPAQSDTLGTAESTYQTVVRPPINADGTSVFAAKRGVVPVQFDVLSGTATPHTIGPVVFESIGGGSNPAVSTSTTPFAWSGLIFTPTTGSMTFDDVASLVATYDFTTGDCWGGSLRWTINVTHNSAPQNVHVYYGDPSNTAPSFQSCSGSYDESGDNLMDNTLGNPANRFEMQSDGQAGWPTAGGLYRTLADAQAVVGTDTVNWIGLILDSGWKSDQVIDPDTLAASVNGNAWERETEGTTYTYSDMAKTCDIPQAGIVIEKTSGSNPGSVDEAQSVQPKDTGEYFRNVDCKLIYNLDVSTLTGTGSYKVQADFGSRPPALDPAIFGLK